jgi:branched-chain amino acid transport system permease protein
VTYDTHRTTAGQEAGDAPRPRRLRTGAGALLSGRRYRPSDLMRLPPSAVGAVTLVIAVAAVCAFGSSFVQYEGALIAIYGIVTVGQDLVIGRAGLISLGAAAIMAVGAFTTAKLTSLGAWGTFPIPLLASAAFGAVVGLIVGIPGLRFRGLYLMLTTLALQYVVSFVTEEYQQSSPKYQGAGFPVAPAKWGTFSLATPRAFFVVCVVILALTLLALRGAFRSAPGRAWSALRQNEGGASTMGVSLVRWKLAAFIGSSAITAVGGSLYAYQSGQVEYTSFSLNLAIVLVIMVFIGGIRTLTGPLLGAAALILLPIGLQNVANRVPPTSGIGQWLSLNEAQLAYAIYGLVLLLVLMYEKDGLWGLVLRLWRLAGRAFAWAVRRRTGTAAPGEQPAGAASTGSEAGQVATRQREPDDREEAADPRLPEPAGAGPVRPAAPPERPLLRARGLSVRYPNGAIGLREADVTARAGEIVAVLGRNGAGKTTLLRAIGGFLASEHVSVHGEVAVAGTEICGKPPYASFRLGTVLVPERDKVFSRLTVEEHLRLASGRGSAADPLVFTQLDRLMKSQAGLLSGGERQMLAMEMAWRSSPVLLLADEISLGLAPVVVRTVLNQVRATVKKRGVAAVIVEQDAAAALRVADTVYVVDRGEIRWHGPATATSPEEIAQRYLGASL